MNPAKRLEIFTRLRAANPAPRTELVYHSPFELLVAVILIVGGLTFLPSLALGPIADQFQVAALHTL